MSYDDWKAETQERLPKSAIYRSLKCKCENDPAGNHVLSLVDDATFFAYQKPRQSLCTWESLHFMTVIIFSVF